MSYENAIFEKKGPVAIVTLNRPAKKNALSPQMHRELIRICEEVERSDELRVMIPQAVLMSSVLVRTWKMYRLADGLPTGPNAIHRLAEMAKPTIAAISGWCVAGELEFALSCDLIVASETARIGDRHIRISFIGGAGSPTRLTRLIGVSKAMELILTGDTIDGKEAQRIGLANRVFPPDKLMEGAVELATKIAGNSSLALQLSKKAVRGACGFTGIPVHTPYRCSSRPIAGFG